MALKIYKDLEQLSEALADWVVNDIQKALETQAKYSLALSGGSTPKTLYKLLSEAPRKGQINWNKLHFFMGDERYVPFEDDRNNAKMAYQTLLNHVPVPKENIHFIDTELQPEESAESYEAFLKQFFSQGSHTFDLVLLGMGGDGHTLSLFPGTEVIHEEKKWVAAPFVAAQDMYRITLTKKITNLSRNVVFLISGEGKAAALKEVLEGDYNPDLYPSQVIKPDTGNLIRFVDQAAASKLQQS